ncbi:1,2-phenylacetyl-CoA epoxidase subunit PaaC [Roseivirga sp. BDSF3-8]|uniref:1,2-phenylacetyl-CoA epoxidase subunit PaaC n=1 Tax=Roseivirga sp. BDSF3-8 TaxID=3241598 RepID=UPI003532015F
MDPIIIKDFLYKVADDQLILGHRNSEWTGVGPVLEEDIAFSSMAQDKVGQSQALYELLHKLGEGEPDTVAFMRNAEQFHNCQFVELPTKDYAFSLIRHFLFDYAELIRFKMLMESSYEPLAQVAAKIQGEIKYHVMHARTFIRQLGSATEESVSRLQEAMNESVPYALGIFEKSKYEEDIISSGLFKGEEALKAEWMNAITEVVSQSSLTLPDLKAAEPKMGGRYGQHTEHLQPLLDEMSEVFRQDPMAEW